MSKRDADNLQREAWLETILIDTPDYSKTEWRLMTRATSFGLKLAIGRCGMQINLKGSLAALVAAVMPGVPVLPSAWCSSRQGSRMCSSALPSDWSHI